MGKKEETEKKCGKNSSNKSYQFQYRKLFSTKITKYLSQTCNTNDRHREQWKYKYWYDCRKDEY